MNTLALDTATEACSVALRVGDSVLSRYQETARDHSRLVLGMIDEVMHEADLKPGSLDALVFGRGPGSFTGVRIAAGVVQGIALVADCPVVPISDLRTIAQRMYRESGAQRVFSAIDARMEEVYWGCFELDAQGIMCACLPELVCAPVDIETPEGVNSERQFAAAGTGWARYEAILEATVSPWTLVENRPLLPHAEDMLTLATDDEINRRGVRAENAIPVYLRDKVAHTRAEREAK
ncbi:MAG: tRNA (adenosine(37)-N6)-threonylcarbamoyltransferase complex dimerization subunit type 1 TsaB [Pseudomonadota bacterium]